MYSHEQLIKAVRAAGHDGKTFSVKDVRVQLGFETRDKKELSRFRRRLRAFEKEAGEQLEKLGNNSYRLKPGAFDREAAAEIAPQSVVDEPASGVFETLQLPDGVAQREVLEVSGVSRATAAEGLPPSAATAAPPEPVAAVLQQPAEQLAAAEVVNLSAVHDAPPHAVAVHVAEHPAANDAPTLQRSEPSALEEVVAAQPAANDAPALGVTAPVVDDVAPQPSAEHAPRVADDAVTAQAVANDAAIASDAIAPQSFANDAAPVASDAVAPQSSANDAAPVASDAVPPQPSADNAAARVADGAVGPQPSAADVPAPAPAPAIAARVAVAEDAPRVASARVAEHAPNGAAKVAPAATHHANGANGAAPKHAPQPSAAVASAAPRAVSSVQRALELATAIVSSAFAASAAVSGRVRERSHNLREQLWSCIQAVPSKQHAIARLRGWAENLRPLSAQVRSQLNTLRQRVRRA